jgi:hypothetical protein
VPISMPAVTASPILKGCVRVLFGTVAISLSVRECHRILLHWVNLSEANTQLKTL